MWGALVCNVYTIFYEMKYIFTNKIKYTGGGGRGGGGGSRIEITQGQPQAVYETFYSTRMFRPSGQFESDKGCFHSNPIK